MIRIYSRIEFVAFILITFTIGKLDTFRTYQRTQYLTQHLN